MRNHKISIIKKLALTHIVSEKLFTVKKLVLDFVVILTLCTVNKLTLTLVVSKILSYLLNEKKIYRWKVSIDSKKKSYMPN